MIFCLACGEELTDNNWHKFNANKKFYRCKDCYNSNAKQNSILRNLNKPAVRNCRVCDIILNDENWTECNRNNKDYLCKSCVSIKSKNYNKETNRNVIRTQEIKHNAFINLGVFCRCCGESDERFLTIDHINNDGAEERKLNNNKSIYIVLKELEYKTDRYQVLCMNCNYSKGHQGICPHNILKTGENCTFCNMVLSDENTFKFHIFGNHKICKDCTMKVRAKLKDEEKYLSNYCTIRTRKAVALNLRLDVIQAYGGKCVCCEESDYYFLTIDHINGGGREHFRELKTKSKDLYRWLRESGYPKNDYQLLCYNCNCAKSIYKECPHKLTKNNIKMEIEEITLTNNMV